MVKIFAIVIVLQTAGIIPLWFSLRVTKNICIAFAVYMSINTVMNVLSDSMKEKLLMTPLSIVGAICFFIVVLNYHK